MKINLNNLYISHNDVILKCRNEDEANYNLQRIQDALNLMHKIELAVNVEEGIRYDLLIENSKSYDPDNI
jgi:hypothetical protein